MTMDNLRLSRVQVREVDRRAVEFYGMSGLVLMENAGRGCVDRLGSLGIAGPLAICCGHGNNGGDGFVIARHLQLRGYEPRVLLAGDPAALRGDAAVNYRILQHCEVPIARLDGWGTQRSWTGCWTAWIGSWTPCWAPGRPASRGHRWTD
jgi:NAD(P)H-hydrate epimerase